VWILQRFRVRTWKAIVSKKEKDKISAPSKQFKKMISSLTSIMKYWVL
jgi:hypothetical protein